MSNTGKFRQNINVKITSNNKKEISASKVRDVLVDAADAIDEIFETFSLADSIGEYNATTGVATVTATGATSTPTAIPAFEDGKYFDVVVAGTKSITGVAVAMVQGGKIIVRGNKWGYVPPSDAALAKVLTLEGKAATSIDLFVDSGLIEATVDANGWCISASYPDGRFYPPVKPSLFDSYQLSAGLLDRIDSGKFTEKSGVNLISSVEDTFGIAISAVAADGYTYPPVTSKGGGALGAGQVDLYNLSPSAIQAIGENKFTDVSAANLISATSDSANLVINAIAADGYPYPPVSAPKPYIPELFEKDTYNSAKSFMMERDTIRRAANSKNPNEIFESASSWWCRPCCISVKGSEWSCVGPSNYSFHGFVTTEGDQFIARVQDYANAPGGEQRKIDFRCVSPASVFQCDEHNVPAIAILKTNKIIVASAGHYDKTEVDVRIWDHFKDDKPVLKLKTNGYCSYAQIVVSDHNVFIFTRDEQYRWSVIISRDSGVSWLPCTPFLLGQPSERAYMATQKASGVHGEFLKVYWYPSTDERDNSFVRYAEVNLATGEILTKQGGDFLGNIYAKFTPIPMYTGGTLLFTNAGTVDEVAGGRRRIRLLDVTGNSRSEAVFMIATLTGTKEESTERNGDYRMITADLSTGTTTTANSTSITLTDYGKAFYAAPSAYMGGAFFEQSINGVRSGTIYLAKYGTASTNYNPVDAANKFRVEKWVAGSFNTLIEESDEQLFRPFTPQYMSDKFGVVTYYMKGLYLSFNNYYCRIKLNRI